MDKDQNCGLLDAVYQTAQSGLKTSEYVRPKAKSFALIDDINSLRAEYNDVLRSAERLSRDCGEQPKDNNLLKKAGLWADVNTKLILDSNSEKQAETIIHSCFNGVLEMTKALTKYPLAELESIELARRLKEASRHAIETFMAYLERGKQ
ncbi:MAG: hypothetical protein FWE53_02105 [Firmicutes bacterium]|nr:hypothetical protein [Bacillota bacterium]